LHTALRDRQSSSSLINQDIQADVCAVLQRMKVFTDKIRNHEWLGVTGQPITDIINIGIGGSHLGPQMTTRALEAYAHPNLRCHFISNIDETHINQVLNQINPESSLFIISSKSFTTFETMYNAKNIYTWLQQKLNKPVASHFVAVTASPENAIEFGIPESQIFTLWDWVGGRYSIWSAIGLPLAIMIGMENFFAFLDGAHAMDTHFCEAPFENNMPIILALIGIWYINFFHASQHAIIPYVHPLTLLPDYLQQLDMESNGKRTHINNFEIDYATGPVIFGKHGCDSQHSYFQLLHQGQHLIPIDFVLSGEQELLVASALSQAQALMHGLKDSQKSIHQIIPGNRPSNMLFLNSVSPFNLGALLALYEHKVYVQGKLWGINSFDQWGVELGKQLLPQILNDLQQNQAKSLHDASTQGLIQHYKKLRMPQ
jgi:glucose-6-phosphate isomerase